MQRQPKTVLPHQLPLTGFFRTPLAGFNAADILLHPVCALMFHLVSDVTIYVRRKCRRSVSKIALHGLNIIPRPDSGNSVGMPLWHNKDLQAHIVTGGRQW